MHVLFPITHGKSQWHPLQQHVFENRRAWPRVFAGDLHESNREGFLIVFFYFPGIQFGALSFSSFEEQKASYRILPNEDKPMHALSRSYLKIYDFL
jgi:hypothetical protein